ncbi:MAG: ankyrin repeat domain-containing protein [Candidatus Schekmanbacteria bacterium]|nr:ankyrin repeat domain-containing protein [Candidatus Schekmanbacteria bacterium]
MEELLERIEAGRTDLVWPYVASGQPATATHRAVRLIEWCAYYGDVSAIRFLLDRGESLQALGANLGLNGAAFHGWWRLCELLLESGADANGADARSGETPLHAALCTADRDRHDLVVGVLLAHHADVNRKTRPAVETGCFMRDCLTKGETPLHRAAVCGGEATLDLLLAAGASPEARDMNGETPLSWASWHGRSDAILRRLCYGAHAIAADRKPLRVALLGRPHGGC